MSFFAILFQIIGLIFFVLGLLLSYFFNGPTVFSYIKKIKNDNYFEKEKGYKDSTFISADSSYVELNNIDYYGTGKLIDLKNGSTLEAKNIKNYTK
jgi:hypothetical protein